MSSDCRTVHCFSRIFTLTILSALCLAGCRSIPSGHHYSAVRIDESGRMIRSFGDDGYLHYPVGPSGIIEVAGGFVTVAIDAQQVIVAGGNYNDDALVRHVPWRWRTVHYFR